MTAEMNNTIQMKNLSLSPLNLSSIKGGGDNKPILDSQCDRLKTASNPQLERDQPNEAVIRLINCMVLISCCTFITGLIASLFFSIWVVATASIMGGISGLYLAGALWITGEDGVDSKENHGTRFTINLPKGGHFLQSFVCAEDNDPRIDLLPRKRNFIKNCPVHTRWTYAELI